MVAPRLAVIDCSALLEYFAGGPNAEAARLAAQTGLAMADAIVLATARVHGAELWTQDADFAGLAGVRYFPKRPSPAS